LVDNHKDKAVTMEAAAKEARDQCEMKLQEA